ncbi:MAG TPA: bacteriohopanetetrol glucosamine biosynthesis glycosyltransferase HpnI [Candidatus Acidoferrales bacterium]|jgi:ceramide glucosyltransferase|nr:bacteriohopanetetrol glucosamine biosynthesis glycosyltransferase HpnI [Candidatus Acidoferrales bacterium]
MRTASILIFVVVTGTGGEICLTHAMKLLGEVHDFRPGAIVKFVFRALRVGWLWFAVFLMAASFFSFLTMLSWFPVSFVIPVTSLAYVAGAIGAKLFLGEKLNATRWAGIVLICLGVGMAWVDNLPTALAHPSALPILRWVILVLAVGPLIFYVIGIYSAWRFFRVAHRAIVPPLDAQGFPPASILKPVRGLDPNAYENFASFCRQSYPEFEILFAVNGPADPVVPVVQKLIADFPERTIRLIFVEERLGANVKVSNLCRLVREAQHDLLVITDSDVRVEPEYLRSVAFMFRNPAVGGVTALYRGQDNLQFVAAMDCVGSSAAFCGAALVARELEGLNFMMGSTMATTRARLAEIGGFEALVDLHSDDYELGHRIAARGHRIELLPEPVWMAFPSLPLGAYLRHELRWAIGIRNIRPGGHFGMLFTHGLPWAIAAACVAPSLAVATFYLVGYFALRFAMAWIVGVWGLRDPVLRRRFWLLPVRDFFSFFVWLASFARNRIEWRGSSFTLENGRMIPVITRANVPE